MTFMQAWILVISTLAVAGCLLVILYHVINWFAVAFKIKPDMLVIVLGVSLCLLWGTAMVARSLQLDYNQRHPQQPEATQQ